MKTKTARQCLIERLSNAGYALAVHELSIKGHSENALATELSKMALAGLVVGRYRPSKRFKEWSLAGTQDAPQGQASPASEPSTGSEA